ncbi:MAG: ABC transporter ATP-binding protein [Spongiibacteraceae bacterium]|nr:ABC transporter ATP-binding protein [Spongiibacteraceae bacterium]
MHLEVVQLTKRFGDLVAVDGISFGIPEGICFGLLGPNGAGKTTTIEIIEGVSKPTSGRILYRGEPRDARFAQVAGIQFQSTALMSFLTVRDVLKLFSRLYRRTLPLSELIERCQLGDFLDRDANKLSGGQKQRLLLALALINDPEIVFLDEPTTGLDPQARRNFWELINSIRQQGKTVVLTTHYMDEAESLCDTLVILDHGRIIAEGSPRALLDQHLPLRRVLLQAEQVPPGVSGRITRQQDEICIETDSVERTLQQLIASGADLTRLRVQNPTLEDLFIQLTGHQLRE